MPKLVLTGDLEEGMVLNDPIKNNYGQALIPAGLELTIKHINMLKMWNIQSVNIQSDDSEDELEFSEETLEEARKILDRRLGWKPRNDVEEDLLQLGVLAIASSLANN